jgi:hypothetical protein
VAGQLMAKAEMPEKPAKELSGLKVRKEDAQLVVKIATMRGLSVEELFQAGDVQTFLRHLLIAEMATETSRLQGKPKR